MRIYERQEFLKLPEGTIYAEGKPWFFYGIHVKGETIYRVGDGTPHDFCTRDLVWVDGHSSEEVEERLDEMKDYGVSYPIESSFGRDGSYDDEALFLVYEQADLIELRGLIEAALTSASLTEESRQVSP